MGVKGAILADKAQRVALRVPRAVLTVHRMTMPAPAATFRAPSMVNPVIQSLPPRDGVGSLAENVRFRSAHVPIQRHRPADQRNLPPGRWNEAACAAGALGET